MVSSLRRSRRIAEKSRNENSLKTPVGGLVDVGKALTNMIFGHVDQSKMNTTSVFQSGRLLSAQACISEAAEMWCAQGQGGNYEKWRFKPAA